LAGTYLALLDAKPHFDFEHGADSVAISGHKFIGSPIPCGVVIVKKSYRDRIGQTIPYIGTTDTTITGSRNGHSPLFLWYAIKNFGIDGLKKRAIASIEMATYVEEELNKIGFEAWRNENSITVVFRKPSKEICKKWQLASEDNKAHIICMPGIEKAMIDACLAEMKAEI
jgi:histidine decarboxylase